MEIHRFELAWLGVSLVVIFGFIATIAYGTVGAGVAMVDDSGGTIDPDAVTAEGSPFADPGVEQAADGDGYVVHVVARQFQFSPGSTEPITVPAGERITFQVTTPDVTHGFSIVETNVNVMVIPGQISEVTAVFDETGTYGIVCHEYCGGGHHTMGGSLEVVPASDFSVGGAAPDADAESGAGEDADGAANATDDENGTAGDANATVEDEQNGTANDTAATVEEVSA